MKRILFSAMLLILASAWPLMAAGGIRGDVNGDGAVNIGDVTALIDYLLADSSETVPVAADVDGNGIVSIADVTVLVDGLLAGAWNDEPAVVTEDLSVNGVAFTMTLVKAGTFTMGATAEQIDEASHNEFPAHQVTITYDFYIGQTEVTQELWLAVMGRNPSEFQGDLQRPVENVTRFDCAIFVDKLTELTGRVFRMPTEAEWEFAARGGNLGQGYKYAGGNDINELGWYEENAGNITHPVASKHPNELGLYDMSGNVFEWCQDWYISYDAEPQINPIGPESGYSSIYRGGSWFNDASGCRVSFRGSGSPDEKNNSIGLRLVMNAEP